MNIRTLRVEQFGSVPYFEAVFRSDVIVLHGIYSAQVALAIKLLTGDRLSKWEVSLFSQATRLYAEVACGDAYCVEVTAGDGPADLHYTVCRRSDGAECTDEYLNRMKQSAESELLNGFSCASKGKYPHRFKQYQNVGAYAPDMSDRIEKTKMFRAVMDRFIRDFKPERLREDKEYWLNLNRNGEFRLVHPSADGAAATALSETDEILYQYLCFLHLSVFWSEINKVQPTRSVEKPLMVSDFIERVDHTMDLMPYIEGTRKLGRQLFLVYPHASPNTHIGKIPNKQVVKVGECVK